MSAYTSPLSTPDNAFHLQDSLIHPASSVHRYRSALHKTGKVNSEDSFIILYGFTSQPLIKNIFCIVLFFLQSKKTPLLLNPPHHQKQSYHKSHISVLHRTIQDSNSVIWEGVLSKNADPLRWDFGDQTQS